MQGMDAGSVYWVVLIWNKIAFLYLRANTLIRKSLKNEKNIPCTFYSIAAVLMLQEHATF